MFFEDRMMNVPMHVFAADEACRYIINISTQKINSEISADRDDGPLLGGFPDQVWMDQDIATSLNDCDPLQMNHIHELFKQAITLVAVAFIVFVAWMSTIRISKYCHLLIPIWIGALCCIPWVMYNRRQSRIRWRGHMLQYFRARMAVWEARFPEWLFHLTGPVEIREHTAKAHAVWCHLVIRKRSNNEREEGIEEEGEVRPTDNRI